MMTRSRMAAVCFALIAVAMADVNPKISDADVNSIFEAALAKCRGIRHEIDALRKQWLLEEFTK